MNFRVTEQYARGEESLFTEFNALEDALLFLAKKLIIDEKDKRKILYRLYNAGDLFKQINQNNVCVTHAHYFDGNGDITDDVHFAYTVRLQVAPSSERLEIARFNDRIDARIFITERVKNSGDETKGDLYFIFKDNQLMDTASNIMTQNLKKAHDGPNGNVTGEMFQPTPLPMKPVPPGFQHSSWVNKEEDDERKKS
jgi:hypothetical protein